MCSKIVLTLLCCFPLAGALRSEPDKALAASTRTKPNILFMLMDDAGWSLFGFNNASTNFTPHLDSLAAEGVVLERHYVSSTCSPTRSVLQSGRNAIHVNLLNSHPLAYNEADPVGGHNGMPRNMTGIAEVLRGAGYATYMIGKWDIGATTPDHTPSGRGYDSSFIYFSHDIDCWNFTTRHVTCDDRPLPDLWKHDSKGIWGQVIKHPGRAAKEDMNSPLCQFENQRPSSGEQCVFLDQKFEHYIAQTIRNHDRSQPMFLFWSMRSVHSLWQPPEEEVTLLEAEGKAPKWDLMFLSMLSWMDRSVGRVLGLLKAEGLYDNTLIVFTSDNGAGGSGIRNYPLRAGKFCPLEGGIRAASFVSGGKLPRIVQGTRQRGLIGAEDWYATFAALAGADPTDRKAARADLFPIDSVNVWPLITNLTTESPRSSFPIGIRGPEGEAAVGGIIVPPWKIVVNGDGRCARETGDTGIVLCGTTPETGCLYDVFADPSESHNLAATHPGIFKELMQQLKSENSSIYFRRVCCSQMLYRMQPDADVYAEESLENPAMNEYICQLLEENHNGFVAPFLS